MSQEPKLKPVVIPGFVQKVIKPVSRGLPEVVEICLPTAQPLYREIRVENLFQDENGNSIPVKEGTRFRVTIEVESDNGTGSDTISQDKVSSNPFS